MAEAPIKWKIDLLRHIIPAPSTARFTPKPDSQEADWFWDMKKDGYVEGDWVTFVDPSKMQVNVITFHHEGPQGFAHLHVTEKGKKLVYDYDSQHTFSGIWKRYHVAILIWIATIVSAVVIECLRSFYFH